MAKILKFHTISNNCTKFGKQITILKLIRLFMKNELVYLGTSFVVYGIILLTSSLKERAYICVKHSAKTRQKVKTRPFPTLSTVSKGKIEENNIWK